MNKLLVYRTLEPSLQEELSSALIDWEISYANSTEEFNNHLFNASIVAGWRNSSEASIIIEKNANLKWIQTWSAGINYLPLPLLEDKNILLTNATGIHAYPISETIFAMLLNFTRKIHIYQENKRKQIWNHSDLNDEIHESTIGILGIGAIGKETAKIAKAFNMNVLGFRTTNESYEFVDEMFTLADLDSQLGRCDYVVVTLPLTPSTKHLFTMKQFKLMKRTAFFINIGRGPITVEDDLVAALEAGIIAGAGLDVFDIEPLPSEHPLWKLDNVMITPHSAGNSYKYDSRMIYDIFLPNVKQFTSNTTVKINKIDYKRGY